MKLRAELLELLRDRSAQVATLISVSLPTIFSLLLDIKGSPEVLWIGLFFFVVLFFVSTSITILIARKDQPDIVIAKGQSLERIKNTRHH